MVGSLRKVPDGAKSHAAPIPLTKEISLAPIPKGSFVDASGDWQYTFLCKGCLGRKDAYAAAKPKEDLAWALSVEALKEPKNPDGPLNHHHGGSGKFSTDMNAAKSDKYNEWAKMSAPVPKGRYVRDY